MIASQDLESILTVNIEANEILNDVEESTLFKQSLKESVESSILGVFIATVSGLPLHKAILTRSDRTGLRCCHITHHTDGVIDKHGRDFIHIVPKLSVRSRSVSFFA